MKWSCQNYYFQFAEELKKKYRYDPGDFKRLFYKESAMYNQAVSRGSFESGGYEAG